MGDPQLVLFEKRPERCDFAGGSTVSRIWLWKLKITAILSSFSFLLVRSVCCHDCLTPSFPAFLVMGFYPSGTINPNTPFLVLVAMVMTFYHSSQKVTVSFKNTFISYLCSVNLLLCAKIQVSPSFPPSVNGSDNSFWFFFLACFLGEIWWMICFYRNKLFSVGSATWILSYLALFYTGQKQLFI